MATKSAILTAIADDTGSSNTDFVTNDSTLTFTGTATLGASGTGKVEVHIDGINVGQVTVDPITLTWSLPVDLNAFGISQGDHVITLWSPNGLNDLAPDQTFGFTYDTIAPSATIDQIIDDDPADNAHITGVVGYATPTNDHTPLLVGHADPFSTVQIYNWGLPVLVNGVAVTVQADAAGHWEYQFTTPLGDEVTDPISGGGDGGNYDFSAVVVGTDLAGNTGTSANDYAITITADPNAVCFLAGTLIANATGEQPIEALAIGDMITLADGTQKPVKWVGRMTVNLNRFNRHTASPILIRAGALGDGLPKRDLYTSYHHGFAVNGVLVIAGLLVNGTSIVQCADWSEATVTYYQVEVEGHALMVVEGAAAETFGEDGDNRALFDNAGEFHALYPNAIPAEPMQMGRVVASRQIPRAVKAAIETAAVEMGYATWAAAA